jgi:hypothetical protein
VSSTRGRGEKFRKGNNEEKGELGFLEAGGILDTYESTDMANNVRGSNTDAFSFS